MPSTPEKYLSRPWVTMHCAKPFGSSSTGGPPPPPPPPPDGPPPPLGLPEGPLGLLTELGSNELGSGAGPVGAAKKLGFPHTLGSWMPFISSWNAFTRGMLRSTEELLPWVPVGSLRSNSVKV